MQVVKVTWESGWTAFVKEAATGGQSPVSVLRGEEENEGEGICSDGTSSREEDRILGF